MACQQLPKVQHKLKYEVSPKDFSYVHGEWCKPNPFKKTAELLYGHNIEATAKFNTEVLITEKVMITVGVSKPCLSFGWENAKLIISAEMGNERVMKDITEEYKKMTPEGGATYFKLPMFRLFKGCGCDKELRITLSDFTNQAKGGLVLHGAVIDELIGGC